MDDPVIRSLVSEQLWGPQIGTYELRLPFDLTWSAELSRLYGVTRQATSVEALLALVHPDDRARVRAECLGVLQSKATGYSHTFRIIRPDGAVRTVLNRGLVERDVAGAAVAIRGVSIDVTDEAQLNQLAERRLQASEERYRKLFDAIDEGFCVVEVDLATEGGQIDYRVVEANPAFYTQTGFPEAILGAWLREAAPSLEEHWFQTYGRVAQTREALRFESHSDHLGRWFDAYAFPLDYPDEKLVAILFTDVSNRKHQEEQTQLLINEISHRSKNMLGVVQAIARNTAAQDASDFARRFGERVQALAASNDLLVRNGWKQVDFAALIRSQLLPFTGDRSERLTLDGPNLALSAVATKAFGMALHELATNAAKYGALANPQGRIRMEWSIDPENAASRRFHLTWVESDGPKVREPEQNGFGWKVTKMMVESTTGGKVTADFHPEGLHWRLDCPADRVLG